MEKIYGKNGLLFKLKIGSEQERQSERAPLWSRPLECATTEILPFSLLVISHFFLRFRFLLRWWSCFLSELDFYGRSFRARVWIFGFFGSGLCSGGVFHEGGGFEAECEQNLKSTLDGLDFVVLIISRWFG